MKAFKKLCQTEVLKTFKKLCQTKVLKTLLIDVCSKRQVEWSMEQLKWTRLKTNIRVEGATQEESLKIFMEVRLD